MTTCPMFQFFNERDPPPVDKQPSIAANSWRLFQRPSGDLHLALYMGGTTWRLTSVIVAVDFGNRALLTSSGRQYSLMLPPAQDETAIAVMRANALGSAPDAVDVSEEFWNSLPATH